MFLRSNGYWNNDLKYIHLLFAGFADVITMCGQKVILLMLSNKVNLFIIMINCQILFRSYLDFTNSQPLYNRYVQSTGDSSITMHGGGGASGGASENGYCGNQPKRSLLIMLSSTNILSN